MSKCSECSGKVGGGLCKNRGANLSVQCNHFTSKEKYEEYSCEKAIEDYNSEQQKLKEESDKKELEKANEGLMYV